jgi:hypothetical protein
MVRFTIYESLTGDGTLDQLAIANKELAIDALYQSGIVLRTNTRDAFRMAHTEYTQYINKNGKKRWKKGIGNFGDRINLEKRSHKPTSMENLITSFVMERQMTLVVGGMHKRAVGDNAQWIMRGGKRIGKSNFTHGVGKGSYAILDKLNSGDTSGSEYQDVQAQYRARGHSVFEQNGQRMRFKPRNFIEQGRVMSMGKIKEIMVTKLEQAIGKALNRDNYTTGKQIVMKKVEAK